MGNIILFIITMVILVLMIYFIYKATNESNSLAEKLSYFLLAIIDIILLSIYYLDRFNIPTALGWNINVNTQNWLNFIGTFITGILGAGIGVITSVFITIYQIKKNNEENTKRDSENLRIQNMPMLKYEIETKRTYKEQIDIEHLIITNCDDKIAISYDLFISIKNIGLNNVKRIMVDFESPIVNNIDRILGNNTVIPIERNETKKIYRYFALESGKKYEIKLKVYYEDVLQNWYCQIVDINYNATNISNGSYSLGNVEYKVNEEVLIDDKEVPSNS